MKQKSLIQSAHSKPQSDLHPHQGLNKTRQEVCEKYFWPNITDDVKKYCNECDLCHANPKKHIQRVAQELHPIAIPQRVWGLVGMDLMTMKKTPDGYQYDFSVIDYFSKWVELMSLKTKCAIEIAENYYELIICRCVGSTPFTS